MQMPIMDRGIGKIVNMLFLALVHYALDMGPTTTATYGRLMNFVIDKICKFTFIISCTLWSSCKSSITHYLDESKEVGKLINVVVTT